MNIDKIEILSNNIKLTIIPNENKLIRQGKSTTITNEEIEQLIRIIRYWKSDYYSNKDFDGAITLIKIYYDNKIDTIKIIRKLPDNYDEFNKYVRLLYGRR